MDRTLAQFTELPSLDNSHLSLLGQFPPFFPFAIMPPLPFAGKMPSLESLASFQYFWFWHVAKLLPLVTYNVSVISRKIWRSCTLDHLSSTAHMKQNDKTGESGFSRKAQKSPERRVVVLFWARRCISRV